MILKNGRVFTENGVFIDADVELKDGKIVKVAPRGTLSGDEELDVQGKYVTPGFVDIHIHGAKGSDFCDNGAEHIETMSSYLGSEGITSFCGTTMAFDEPILQSIFETARPYINKETGGAVLRAVDAGGLCLGVRPGRRARLRGGPRPAVTSCGRRRQRPADRPRVSPGGARGARRRLCLWLCRGDARVHGGERRGIERHLLGGAALGTAGGFAAAGATTAAVMALGTASTGTAIASLSGAAAVNATLAALGGGALAAGGGGMALGSAVLGAATLGVGILVGGIIFNLVGKSISDKADEAWNQMKEAEDEINQICQYLNDLYVSAGWYKDSLLLVQKQYEQHLQTMKSIILEEGRTDWNAYTSADKITIENTVLLVGLLYKMCKVQVVLQSQEREGMNQVNHKELNQNVADAKSILQKIA